MNGEEALHMAINAADVDEETVEAAWGEVERLRAAAATHKRVEAVIGVLEECQQWRVCRPDDKYIGLCNTHGSIMRGEVCEATLIQRVRELHTPYRIMLGSVPTDTNCNGCNRTYPCPTIRALEGAE